MTIFGAKIRWQDGCIMHPASYWKSPSRRRLPKLLVESRALKVGILVYIEEPWVYFKETNIACGEIATSGATPLQFYAKRFHLLPARFKRQNTYEWLSKPNNALLLFGKDGQYFVTASKRH